MVKQRHGPDWALTQNKLKQAWLSMGSISVYLSESEHGSTVMKLKKEKKKGRKKLNRVEQASVFGWRCHGDRVHGCR